MERKKMSVEEKIDAVKEIAKILDGLEPVQQISILNAAAVISGLPQILKKIQD